MLYKVMKRAQHSDLSLPNAQQCAILVLRLIEVRGEESAQPASRVRLSELTLKRLWCRSQWRPEFLEEVQEWLWRGGWTLFYAQNTYAAIKTSAVQSWARTSSNRMEDEIKAVQLGEFNYSKHLHLLSAKQVTNSDD